MRYAVDRRGPPSPIHVIQVIQVVALKLLPLVVTFEVNERRRAAIAIAVAGATDLVFLADLAPSARAQALRSAGALLVRNLAAELEPAELPLIVNVLLVQFLTAGVDFLPLRNLPADLPLANNGGAYAQPMAEHALAMTLAAAKRLFVEHRNLARGEFNQFTLNKSLAGGVCGIFGFGGVGQAVAGLMRCLGMRIHAINRSGATQQSADWMGTPDRLAALLAAADVFVIAAPLTPATQGVIGATELALMKKDAILVNVARGEIVDERALYQHLRANPEFTACIEAWWIEPVRHGKFEIHQPFFDLPNVIGAPHNSASVPGSHEAALRYAVDNCLRALRGEPPQHRIRPEERMR